MTDNPAKSFALWMAKQRQDLKITLDELEVRTGIKKQHLSTLERAAPHSLTGKAVVPKRPTVEKIAVGLKRPISEGMAAAGYASDETKIPLQIKAEGFEGLDKDDLQEIADFIRFKKLQKKAS